MCDSTQEVAEVVRGLRRKILPWFSTRKSTWTWEVRTVFTGSPFSENPFLTLREPWLDECFLMGVSPFGFAPFSLSGYGCGVTNFVTTLDTCYLSRCGFRLCFLRIRIVNCSPNQFGYRSAGLSAFFFQPLHLPRQQTQIGSVHLHNTDGTTLCNVVSRLNFHIARLRFARLRRESRSRVDAAMKNGTVCKILCHNLVDKCARFT